ncbi:MAG: hypothetical protein II891_04345 [Bacteroidales bacterium]|nr:hypothetical protein [Bacteroidales bacterium]
MKTIIHLFGILLILLTASCNQDRLPPKVTPNKGLTIDNRDFSFTANGGSAIAHFKGLKDRWFITGCTEYLFIDNNWKDIGSTHDEWLGITLTNYDLLTGSWYAAYKPKDEDGQYSVNELHITVNQNDTGERRRVRIYLGGGPNTDSIYVTQEAD